VADALDLPEEQDADEPWYIEAKDKDPAAENKRQGRVLSRVASLCPAIAVVAVPNAGKRSDWERLERWREGARAGMVDLIFHWEPTRAGDRGTYFCEMKDGKKMPTPAQRDRLNLLFRQGHRCGVHRTADTVIASLRAAGAPFLDVGGQ
jgi:hypothetical protein